MKKTISIFLTLLIIICGIFFCLNYQYSDKGTDFEKLNANIFYSENATEKQASVSDGKEVNETNFPDQTFRMNVPWKKE